MKDITDWHVLGVYLRIPKNKLDVIKAQHQSQGIDKCKLEVLEAWLRENPDASWKQLIDVLTLMDKNTLAALLEERYLQSIPMETGNIN